MIFDNESSDNGKAERALKRELDQVFDSDSSYGGDDYGAQRGKVEDRKKQKRLAKLQKKLARRKRA